MEPLVIDDKRLKAWETLARRDARGTGLKTPRPYNRYGMIGPIGHCYSCNGRFSDTKECQTHECQYEQMFRAVSGRMIPSQAVETIQPRRRRSKVAPAALVPPPEGKREPAPEWEPVVIDPLLYARRLINLHDENEQLKAQIEELQTKLDDLNWDKVNPTPSLEEQGRLRRILGLGAAR